MIWRRIGRFTEPPKSLCTLLREVYEWPFLTLLPGPAWVLLSYVLQNFILGSILALCNMGYNLLTMFESPTTIFLKSEHTET